MAIKWQRGTFVKFFAQMKIRVGGQNSTDIQAGDEFEYDGSILKYAGAEVATPQLRGAIDAGWATFNEEAAAPAAPARPSRNVAKSQTVNRDLSRVQRTSSMETSTVDEDEVLRIGDRAATSKGADPRILQRDDNRRVRGMEITGDLAGDQEAVTIGRVRTSAKTVFADSTRSDAVSRQITALENQTPKAALFAKEKTVEREGVSIRTTAGVRPGTRMSQEDEGVVVGRVRKTDRAGGGSGVTVQDTSNIREERARAQREAARASGPKQSQAAPAKKPAKAATKPAPKAAAKPAAKAAKSPPMTMEGLAPKAPAKAEKITDPRVRVARAFDPSFPNSWTFTGKLADRIKAVRDHGATPQFVQALFAAEGDQMRKKLSEEFPKLLEA
jgi:hypothetical protein